MQKYEQIYVGQLHFCVRVSICCVFYRKMVKNHMRKSACGAQRHRGEKSKSRFKRRWAKTKGNGGKSTIYPRKITWHKGRKRHLRGNFIEAWVQTNMMGAETVWKGNKTRRDKAPNTEPAPTEKVKINKQMQKKSPIYDQSPVVPGLLRSP